MVSFRDVRLVGFLTIGLVFCWQAQFVLLRYFYQGDIVDLDLARRSGFGWSYLTLASVGGLSPGLRALAWVLARASLYDWPVDGGILVLLAGGAALAAFLALRTLFGDGPVILIPLIVYLLCPLVVPDLGWWWPGMQVLPFQLAAFLAVGAHVRYVRSGLERDLVPATGWVVLGLLFSAKAVFLPLLLFALTSAFLTGAASWRSGGVEALRRYARAWRWYGIAVVCYAVVYFSAVVTSGARSSSAGAAFGPSGPLTGLVTGLVGGPWRWRLTGPGGLYAVAFPPGRLVWAAIAVAVITVGLSVWARPIAGRAWLILGVWVLLGDPVPVLAICVGLAFFPLAGQAVAEVRPRRDLVVRAFCLGLGAMFIAGSIWSDQVYENLTNGYPPFAAYLNNAGRAVAAAAPGTNVLDLPVPAPLVSPAFGLDVYESVVIGPLTSRLHWISRLHGTITGLKMFGSDGRLYPTFIYGVRSPRRTEPGFASCWPDAGQSVTVRFPRTTTRRDDVLQINYIWGAAPALVKVRYGDSAGQIRLLPGLHNAYLRVLGRVSSFTVYGDVRHLCVGGAEAGVPVPL